MADFDGLFFTEVLVGGLLSGVMYSLVAIGFVLIYKTSGVLNFAQGAMLLFAALTFVSLTERGFGFPLAFLVTFAIMILLGIGIERTVLRPLTNKPPITMFMATLGLSYMIEGQPNCSGARRYMGLIWALRMFLSISRVCLSASSIFSQRSSPLGLLSPCPCSFAIPALGLVFVRWPMIRLRLSPWA